MVFNSLIFLAFLAVVLTAYYRLPHRGQNILLLIASYFFYGWWDWRFLVLLVFTSLFDYGCALWIEGENRPARRRLFLSFSMIVNLGVLCTFKYFNFFADSLQHVLAFFGMKATLPVIHVILPLGISFYTFLSMSYTIDVYRRELKATRNPLDFMLYVAFFPHLVAGPIVRASYLLPQCQHPRVIRRDEVINGVWLILLGYVKKVVIADRLANIVSWGFSHSSAPFSDGNAWLVLYAFAFQIYGDFSGYSDIARGLSKLMGFELIPNFKAPYLVTNPSEFWRNWHISLSTWLRDYLYVPLGGNRRGSGRTYANLMTTMVLGGLWHGAGIAYILWGVYHGALLAVHRLWQHTVGSDPAQPHRWIGLRRAALAFIFFHVICIGWLLFRAGALSPHLDSMHLVMSYLHAMVRLPVSGVSLLIQPVLFLGGLALFFQWQHARMDHFSSWKMPAQAVATGLSLAAIAGLGIFQGTEFIYFQF